MSADKRRCYRLRKRYGITLEEYNVILAEQDGKCAICHAKQSDSERTFPVDHDHEGGKVRGILCTHCNLILGHAFDDHKTLMRAAVYLLDNEPSIT